MSSFPKGMLLSLSTFPCSDCVCAIVMGLAPEAQKLFYASFWVLAAPPFPSGPHFPSIGVAVELGKLGLGQDCPNGRSARPNKHILQTNQPLHRILSPRRKKYLRITNSEITDPRCALLQSVYSQIVICRARSRSRTSIALKRFGISRSAQEDLSVRNRRRIKT